MAIHEDSAALAAPAEAVAVRRAGLPGRRRSFALRILAVLGFLVLWHLAVQANVTWPLQLGNLPKPGEVLAAWTKNLGQSAYYEDVGVSCYRVLVGIALGLVTAVPLGLWSGLSRTASDTLFTNLELFRPIPLIAYLPVAMLLFRSIESSILFITYIGAFFPILISSRDAAKRVPPSLVQAARILGCSPLRALWRVYLPAMAPEIFTGLSVGIGASWMGVITAEMMSGQLGIGYSTWSAYHLMDYKQSMIGMFTIGALGFGSSALVRVIQHRVLRWM
ncbi:ABC transporter permease [Paenibacillus sp. S-38]|uniref:ABC transporter permease n=1 Tax=Paenibacillus sp. S-38 TaxID=3416710 RepID=UPI003CFBBD00